MAARTTWKEVSWRGRAPDLEVRKKKYFEFQEKKNGVVTLEYCKSCDF